MAEGHQLHFCALKKGVDMTDLDELEAALVGILQSRKEKVVRHIEMNESSQV